MTRWTTGRRIAVAVGAVNAVLLLPSAASATEVTKTEAFERVKPYAQRVVDQTAFVGARIGCVGDDVHKKVCNVNYDTQATRDEEARRQAAWVCPRLPGPVQPPCGPRKPKRLAPYACIEQLQVYHRPDPHGIPPPGTGLPDYNLYMKHISRSCGPSRILGPTFA